MPCRFRSACVLVFLSLCVSWGALDAAAVRAQDDARARAAAHWKRGVEQANQQKYAQALAEFEAAYALVQHAATLYNIALAQLGLERPAAASATLRRYLAQPAERGGEAKRKAASALLDELSHKLEAAQPAKLTIVVFPYGEAWVDDRAVGSSPITLDVAPGTHRVSGGREGQAMVEEVLLEPGETKRVVLAWGRRELAGDAEGAGEPSASGAK